LEGGTAIHEKYLFIQQSNEPADRCVPRTLANALARGRAPEDRLVSSGYAQFWRSHERSGAAGHWGDATIYMAFHGETCVTLTAVLEGTNPGAYLTPPPLPRDEESKTFEAIISTFRWIGVGAAG
jgi:hypothetical protein